MKYLVFNKINSWAWLDSIKERLLKLWQWWYLPTKVKFSSNNGLCNFRKLMAIAVFFALPNIYTTAYVASMQNSMLSSQYASHCSMTAKGTCHKTFSMNIQVDKMKSLNNTRESVLNVISHLSLSWIHQ